MRPFYRKMIEFVFTFFLNKKVIFPHHSLFSKECLNETKQANWDTFQMGQTVQIPHLQRRHRHDLSLPRRAMVTVILSIDWLTFDPNIPSKDTLILPLILFLLSFQTIFVYHHRIVWSDKLIDRSNSRFAESLAMEYNMDLSRDYGKWMWVTAYSLRFITVQSKLWRRSLVKQAYPKDLSHVDFNLLKYLCFQV